MPHLKLSIRVGPGPNRAKGEIGQGWTGTNLHWVAILWSNIALISSWLDRANGKTRQGQTKPNLHRFIILLAQPNPNSGLVKLKLHCPSYNYVLIETQT